MLGVTPFLPKQRRSCFHDELIDMVMMYGFTRATGMPHPVIRRSTCAIDMNMGISIVQHHSYQTCIRSTIVSKDCQ